MSAQKMFDDAFLTADALLDDVKKVVDRVAQADIEYPTFEQIQTKGVIYNLYVKFVTESDTVTREIVKLSNMLLILRDMKRSLDQATIPFSIKSNYKDRATILMNIVEEYSKVLRDYKVHVDAVLRFCSGLQYLLASPRLWSID